MAEIGSRVVQIQLSSGVPLPPAAGANFFHFVSAGEEVHMLVGTVSLLRVHENESPGRSPDRLPIVTPEITHRFLLSPLGFANLIRQIDEIRDAVNVSRSKSAPIQPNG